MIASLMFPVIAAGLVHLAGRRDKARDPRLTIPLLALSALFPAMVLWMPKIGILPATETTTHPGDDYSPAMIAFAVWIFGFAIALTRLIRAAWHLRHWRRISVESSHIRSIAVRELSHLRGPVAAGIFNPVIFVPPSWSAHDRTSQHAILEHELAHHQRHDPLWRLLAELACAVYWFHPLIHWMKHRFIMQSEFACDSIVLQQGIDPKNYARTLCNFASESSISPLAPAMADPSPLESRIRRMLRPPAESASSSLLPLTALALIAACSLAMLGPRHQPDSPVPASEIKLRLTANPFPADA